MREPVNKHQAGRPPGVPAGKPTTDNIGTSAGNGHDSSGNYPLDLLNAIPNGTIFSYNLDESETPGQMRVRWKVRVATGPEAARWDALQADAIREALLWAHRHLPPPHQK